MNNNLNVENNDLDNNELNEIIENVVDFVNDNKEKLNSNYEKGKSNIRRSYIKQITMDEYIENLVKVSVVIITANEFEENILNYYSYFDQKNPSNNPILEVDQKIKFKNKDIKFDAYLLKINNYDVLHLHAKHTGSYTIGGSADIVRYIAENEYIHPTCIISFGICFGHSWKQQSLGDTIIAKKLYPYFVGAKLSDGKLTIKSDEFVLDLEKTSEKLYEKLEILNKNGKLAYEERNGIERNTSIGNLITGEAVVSDQLYKEIFEDAARIVEPKGGEMEGYGLGKECMFYDIPCMLIKSICDWGAAKNIDEELEKRTNVNKCKDRIQGYTSYCAYTVLKKLFDESLFDESLFDIFKRIFLNKRINSGCYLSCDDINDEFNKYNMEFNNVPGFKEINQNYIEKFCFQMCKEKLWKEKNDVNRKGYYIY